VKIDFRFWGFVIFKIVRSATTNLVGWCMCLLYIITYHTIQFSILNNSSKTFESLFTLAHQKK